MDDTALTHLYHIPDSAAPAVAGFLKAHANLNDILPLIPAQINQHFPEANLSLRLMHDPLDSAHNRLAVTVHTRLPLPQAVRALDAFQTGWWQNQSDQYQGRIVIDLA